MMFKQQPRPAASVSHYAAILALACGLVLAASSGAWAQAAKPAAPAQAAPAQATPPAAGAAAQPAQTPPEVQQEAFGDWRVVCLTQAGVKRCTMIQEQSAAQTRQRVLAMEVSFSGDKLEGLLVLPFGVILDRGVVLQMDEQPAQPTLRFRTCLPSGCFVPLSFDAKAIANLRSGKTLKIRITVDGGPDPNLAVSLNGFGQAVDRLAALRKG